MIATHRIEDARLAGARTNVPAYRAGRSMGRRAAHGVFLGAPPTLPDLERDESLLAPVFSSASVLQLLRSSTDALDRFSTSFRVCGPGDTEGHTRTHLKPTSFVEGFERGGAPRFSARTQDGVRDGTRWLCSYAIARLAELARP